MSRRSVEMPGVAGRVVVSGGYTHVANDTQGLRVVDITQPSSPFEIGSLNTPGNAFGIAVEGDLAFVADRLAGMEVFRRCSIYGRPLDSTEGSSPD